jgi:YVTN family beta-propeller protein
LNPSYINRLSIVIFLFSSFMLGQPSVYVAGNGSNDVSVIQPTTNTLLTTISVGVGPASMAANADGTLLFVANQNSNTLSVIQTATNTQIDVIPLTSNPLGLAVGPEARRAYVSFSSDNRVGVYDLRTKAQTALIPVANGPIALAIHPNGSRLYVCEGNGAHLIVIDTFFNLVIARIPIGNTATGITISPDGARVYVSTQFPGPLADQGPGAIWSIDTRRNEVIGMVRGSFGDPLAMSQDGHLLYAINEIGLATLQAEPLALLKSDPLDGFINSIGVYPVGTTLYLVYPSENLTRVFDTAISAVVATIPTGNFPLQVAIPTPRPRPN